MFNSKPQMFRQQNPKMSAQMKLAQSLMERGTDTSPIQHPLQGIARLAQALSGAYIQNKIATADKAERGEAMKAFTRGMGAKQWDPSALIGEGGPEKIINGVPGQDNYDEWGYEHPPEYISQADAMQRAAPAGGFAGASYALSQLPDNYYAQEMAPQMAMQEAMQRQAAQQEQAKYRRGREDKLIDRDNDYTYQLALEQAKAGLKPEKPPAQKQMYDSYVEQERAAGRKPLSLYEYQINLAGAKASATEAAKNANIPTTPMPPTVNKMLEDHGSAISTARGINADLNALVKQIDDGTLKPSAINNMEAWVRNQAGASTNESRAIGSFRATLEKIRNDSLRLNKGMQTEGDATRAMNEIMANANDEKFVKQRLIELQAINQRAEALRQYQANGLLQQYGRGPLNVPDMVPSVGAAGNGADGADYDFVPGQGLVPRKSN